MKTVQIIKKVNNTELGKGGTHETYVLVPQELDVSELFEEIGHRYSFIDKITGKTYMIRLTCDREKRIVGLGPFYREHNVCAGDEVLFEKRTLSDGNSKFYIAVNKYYDNVFFQKVKDAFEVLTPNRLDKVLNPDLITSQGQKLRVNFSNEIKKRADSPVATKIYSIDLDGISIGEQYVNNDILEISIKNSIADIYRFVAWKKYVIEV